MSTEDPQRPRTRAEARALREAADAAADVAPQPAAPAPDPVPAAPAPAAQASSPPADAPASASEPRGAAAASAPPEPAERAPRRRFALALTAVVAGLALVGGGLALLSLAQGPRLTSVQVDPAEAISLSGSRIILTVNEPLAEIDAAQVTVSPEVPFTVDAAGRNIGVRFSVPLDDDTEYTVTVSDAVGVGEGPASDLSTTFRTPPAEVYLLRRTSGDDTIFRTDLTGEEAVVVFSHDRIDDFRETADSLVVVVEEDDFSRVTVVPKDGSEPYDLELPGDGYVAAVQVSDRGGLVGYVYSDREITETSGRASVLATQPLSGAASPTVIEVAGEEANIAQWQFVPDSSSLVFLEFSGTLFVADRTVDGEPSPMGLILSIQGIERGTYTAVVQGNDGDVYRLDLATGEESALPVSDPDFGPPDSIHPYPGGTAQFVVERDEYGMPRGQSVVSVSDDGTAAGLYSVSEGDAILQVCPSPSGQYLAIAIAPKLVDNPYDGLLLPMPERMETHLLDLRTGDRKVVLSGFNVSWCSAAPVM